MKPISSGPVVPNTLRPDLDEKVEKKSKDSQDIHVNLTTFLAMDPSQVTVKASVTTPALKAPLTGPTISVEEAKKQVKHPRLRGRRRGARQGTRGANGAPSEASHKSSGYVQYDGAAGNKPNTDPTSIAKLLRDGIEYLFNQLGIKGIITDGLHKTGIDGDDSSNATSKTFGDIITNQINGLLDMGVDLTTTLTSHDIDALNKTAQQANASVADVDYTQKLDQVLRDAIAKSLPGGLPCTDPSKMTGGDSLANRAQAEKNKLVVAKNEALAAVLAAQIVKTLCNLLGVGAAGLEKVLNWDLQDENSLKDPLSWLQNILTNQMGSSISDSLVEQHGFSRPNADAVANVIQNTLSGLIDLARFAGVLANNPSKQDIEDMKAKIKNELPQDSKIGQLVSGLLDNVLNLALGKAMPNDEQRAAMATDIATMIGMVVQGLVDGVTNAMKPQEPAQLEAPIAASAG